jgi:hypothetical protein
MRICVNQPAFCPAVAPVAGDRKQLEAIIRLQVYRLNFCARLFCGFASIGIPFGSARDHVHPLARLAFVADDDDAPPCRQRNRRVASCNISWSRLCGHCPRLHSPTCSAVWHQ